MKKLLALLLIISFAFGTTELQAKGGKPSARTYTRPSSNNKTVHVKSYTKKDGTHVSAYDRRPPGSKEIKSKK